MAKVSDPDEQRHSQSETDEAKSKWEKFSEEPDAEESDNLEDIMEEEMGKSKAKKKAHKAPDEVLEEAKEPTSVESVEFPSRQKLEDQLTSLENQVLEYKNQAMGAMAELANLRKRTEREITKAHQYGIERLITDLLPVVDSLVRGLEGSKPEEDKAKVLWKGMHLTLDLLEKTLEKNGVNRINPEVGESFNPELHEAMSMQPDDNANSNTILQVLQRGYQLNGRVIRAAMVIVVA